MTKIFSGITRQYNDFKQLNSKDKKTYLKELLGMSRNLCK